MTHRGLLDGNLGKKSKNTHFSEYKILIIKSFIVLKNSNDKRRIL